MGVVYIDTSLYISADRRWFRLCFEREDGMTLRVRIWLLGTVACAVIGFSAPVAQGAFGVESFFAANCNAASETCNKAANPADEKENAEKVGYTQAAGHPPFGVTDFTVTTREVGGAKVPEGVVDHVRTDVAPGVSTNPEAVPKCSLEHFGAPNTPAEVAPGVFSESSCEATEIGVNNVVVAVEPVKGVFADVPLEGKVYNLEQSDGLSSLFGVAVNLTNVGHHGLFAHTLIEGHVEWGAESKGTGKADYHDFFEINVSPTLRLISSRLVFKGDIGVGGFLTNPTSCTGPGPQTTSTLHLESAATESTPAETAVSTYTTPIGTEGCNGLPPFALVPFAPTFSLAPETKQSDQPDGIATELALPHDPSPTGIDSSQLKTASVALPEGMTLNPSAAQGLEACTPAQARIHSPTPGVACPAKSEIGTVTLNVPGLPPGSLAGSMYLGGPESGPITGPPYTMYLDAESARYGVSVRLKGEVVPNETTGRVTATFSENPEQPFSDMILHFKGGALAPIANPLVCGPARVETSLVPYTGTATQSPFSEFAVDSNNAGGACPSPLPFSLGQSTASTPTTEGPAPTSRSISPARTASSTFRG